MTYRRSPPETAPRGTSSLDSPQRSPPSPTYGSTSIPPSPTAPPYHWRQPGRAPARAGIGQSLDPALADSPALSVEITRMRAELAGARLDLANLAAAALATLAAHGDGEPDSLSYMRDEL